MESQENKKLTRKEKKSLRKQNRNIEDIKGTILVLVLAVIALVLFINANSAYKEYVEPDKMVIDFNPSYESTTTTPIVTPEPQTTQQPTVPAENENTTTPTSPTESGEITKEEILQAVADGVNYIKSDSVSYTAVRSQNIELELQECSLPAFVSVVNKVMNFFEGETVTDYSFTNGKGKDPKTGEEITADSCIPPSNNPFTLTMDGVADATMRKDGENTVYTIVVVPESSTMDNPRPPYHKSAGDTFDCRNVPLPFGEITKADFDYPGSTISVTVAPDGKVVRYQQILKIDGVGEGAAMGLTASGKILGQVDEIWNITY